MKKLGCLSFCLLILGPVVAFAKTKAEIIVKNKLPKSIVDYTLEIPAGALKLDLGNYIAEVDSEIVPVELTRGLNGQSVVVVPIREIGANKKLKINISQGDASLYPKRTYAELIYKTGEEFKGNPKEEELLWVKNNSLTLPGSFRDHSYFLKYEGPGWENDKVAFRLYLDNRNAIDPFGKRTSDLVLPFVGVNVYNSYHKMAYWGMDNSRVGAGLGLGTVAVWDGKKAVRVEKRDSTTCIIQADGKIRSQIKTIYHGWDANGVKCDLTALITIDAGSRASRMELLVDREMTNLATGINKYKDCELITEPDPKGEWTYIATWGRQTMNLELQGLALFVRTRQLEKITEDPNNHVVVFKPTDGGVIDYYFMPVWELDKEPVKTREHFMRCIDEVLDRLNDNLEIDIK